MWPYGMQHARFLCLWDSPGKYTGVGCHALLQGIFPTQGLYLCLIMFPALAGRLFTTSATWEALYKLYLILPMYNHWRRQWHPTPVLLPGKSHGQRSLVGCSPWGRWGSETTVGLHFHFSLSCIGEGNGNPLQCSCLENPRDRGAWWAAVYGVVQSWTWLMWLSSSMYNHKINVCKLTSFLTVCFILFYFIVCLYVEKKM